MTRRHQNSRLSIERMEKRELLAADLGCQLLADSPAPAEGTAETDFAEVARSETEGYNGGKWFVADSFSFGVEREMKESGEKGGTADINIGIGELQKSSDATDEAFASWNTSGDADDRPTEEVAFYYNKIAFQYASTVDGKADGVVNTADYTVWRDV